MAFIGTCSVKWMGNTGQERSGRLQHLYGGTIKEMCGRSGFVSRTAGDVEKMQDGTVRVTVSRNNSYPYHKFGHCYVVEFTSGFKPSSLPEYHNNDISV